MSEGELGYKLKAKIVEGQGRVSFAFGIKPILEETRAEFNRLLTVDITNVNGTFTMVSKRDLDFLLKKIFGEASVVPKITTETKQDKVCPYIGKDKEPPCAFSSFEGELCKECDGGVNASLVEAKDIKTGAEQ
jgi:hypothetical protein